MKEKELYGKVRAWLKSEIGSQRWVKGPVGKRKSGIPDVVGIDWMSLSSPKLYVVEVKKAGPIKPGLYQALRYKYGSHRSYLAMQDERIRETKARGEAEHLGVGLLFITPGATRIQLIRSAIESPPADIELFHEMLRKAFRLVYCVVCNSYMDRNKADSTTRESKDLFPKRKGKPPTHPIPNLKRYICKKCQEEFGWRATKKKRGRPKKS